MHGDRLRPTSHTYVGHCSGVTHSVKNTAGLQVCFASLGDSGIGPLLAYFLDIG